MGEPERPQIKKANALVKAPSEPYENPTISCTKDDWTIQK
jgi:hypothetical protein